MPATASPDLHDPVSDTTAPQTPPDIAAARVAIVDDDPLIVRLIRRQLEKLGYRLLLGLSDPAAALAALEAFRPDVVLLDVMMPELSGTELLYQMRQHPRLHDTPVITLTASRDRITRLQILELGVADFLSKPVDETELSTRLRNVIEAKRYRDHLSQSARQLEEAVRQRTKALEASRREVVQCLARAAEYRDDSTGRHVLRVGRYAAILASALGLPDVFSEMIELAAQLHDVGKIGIPDIVLRKPSRLTEEEMSIMREHADYGWKIIAPMAESGVAQHAETADEMSKDLQSPMLIMAANIAASHHERWDGAGYPQRLAGRDIPVEARITTVADVFDALSTARCYKAALPLDRCFEIIQEERGRQFDPQVVDASLAARCQIEAAFHEMVEENAGS